MTLRCLRAPLAVVLSISAISPIEASVSVPPRVATYVDAIIGAGSDTKPMRWEDPLCINQVGLDDNQKLLFRTRASQLATIAGVRVDQSNCTSNVTVIYTADAGATAKAIVDHNTAFLNNYPSVNRSDFLDNTGVVRWLLISGLSASSTLGRSGIGQAGQMLNSRIRTPTRRVAIAGYVVVDSTKLSGITLPQITDAIMMILLTGPRSMVPPPGSVIDVAAGAAPDVPKAATPIDLSYLRAAGDLTHSPSNIDQKAALENAMAKDASVR